MSLPMTTEPPYAIPRPMLVHREFVWLALSFASLVAYLLCSVSVRAFVEEVIRLAGKL